MLRELADDYREATEAIDGYSAIRKIFENFIIDNLQDTKSSAREIGKVWAEVTIEIDEVEFDVKIASDWNDEITKKNLKKNLKDHDLAITLSTVEKPEMSITENMKSSSLFDVQKMTERIFSVHDMKNGIKKFKGLSEALLKLPTPEKVD